MTTATGNVLVTGATGFIGSHVVVRILATENRDVYCVVRTATRGKKKEDSRQRLLASLVESCGVRGIDPAVVHENAHRIHVVAGDLSLPALGLDDEAAERLAGAGIREAWHIASSLEYEESARESVEKSNVDGTRALLDLCRRASVATFHYISTAYVAGTQTGTIPEALIDDIDDPSGFCNAYEQSKARAEHEVAGFCKGHGIRYRIFRPSIVVGDSRTYRGNSNMGLYGLLRRLHLFRIRTNARMPGFLATKRLRLYGDGSIPLDMIPIDAFLDQTFGVAAAEGTEDDVFHITNPSPPSLAAVAKIVGWCNELLSLEMSMVDEDFDTIDNAFKKSYDFYRSYFQGAKHFAKDKVARAIGEEAALRRPLAEAELEKYIVAYLERLIGVEGDRSVFGPFSRSAMVEKQTLARDGVTLSYFVTESEKPPLVLINAFGMDLEFWGPTVNFFKDRFRIITWNLRGLPDSARFRDGVDVTIDAHVEDLDAVLRAEKIDRAVVMGWCAGPKIALEFYRRYAAKVRGLVLVTGKYDTLSNPDPETSSYSQLFTELNQRIKESPFIAKLIVDSIFSARSKSSEGAAANTILSACSPSIEFAAYAVAPFQTAENLVVYSRMSSSLGEHDVYNMLADVDVPTLIVAAENDAIAHPVSSKRLAQHIKSSELVVLPHASHFCLVESPGTFVHTVSRYLESNQLG